MGERLKGIQVYEEQTKVDIRVTVIFPANTFDDEDTFDEEEDDIAAIALARKTLSISDDAVVHCVDSDLLMDDREKRSFFIETSFENAITVLAKVQQLEQV